MNATKLKLLPLAAALSLGLGVAGNAQAEAYALSYNNILNLFVVDSPDATAFALSNASTTAATLTGFAGCSNAAAGSALVPADSTACNINVPGVPKAENDMTPYGNVAGSNFARSDAQIVSSGAIALGQAWNVAESRVGGNLLSTGNGNNSSETGLTYQLQLGETTTIVIGFEADPYMESFLDPTAQVGSFARAILSATATITDGTGATVFNWVPNGGAGGITGGTEQFDPFSLNLTVARTPLAPGLATYDPTGSAAVDMGDLTPSTTGFFQATTILPAGTYTLVLAMTERTETTRIPEPASLGLVGLALLGLGAAARRRKAG